jgi:hypothetical protein
MFLLNGRVISAWILMTKRIKIVKSMCDFIWMHKMVSLVNLCFRKSLPVFKTKVEIIPFTTENQNSHLVFTMKF